MNELHKLRESLCRELEKYGGKELSAGSLDVVDKLTHTLKNLDKIIEGGEYSERRYPMDSYPRRYSRDGYSYGGMVDDLRDLMRQAKDERTRQEFKRFIDKIESM